MSQSDIYSAMFVGRPQDVNLIVIHKVGFEENFPYISWLQVYIRHWRAKISFKT